MHHQHRVGYPDLSGWLGDRGGASLMSIPPPAGADRADLLGAEDWPCVL